MTTPNVQTENWLHFQGNICCISITSNFNWCLLLPLMPCSFKIRQGKKRKKNSIFLALCKRGLDSTSCLSATLALCPCWQFDCLWILCKKAACNSSWIHLIISIPIPDEMHKHAIDSFLDLFPNVHTLIRLYRCGDSTCINLIKAGNSVFKVCILGFSCTHECCLLSFSMKEWWSVSAFFGLMATPQIAWERNPNLERIQSVLERQSKRLKDWRAQLIKLQIWCARFFAHLHALKLFNPPRKQANSKRIT